MARVHGRCPRGCGETLFLAKGGHVTCSFADCPEPDAASKRLAKEPDAQITLHAIHRASGHLTICDQDGREFDAKGAGDIAMGEKVERVMLEISLHAPYFPQFVPRAEVSFSIPLEVEERLPSYLAEILAPRPGIALVGWMP